MSTLLFRGLRLGSCAVGAAVLMSVSGAAEASLFSFASDDESDSPTFRGTAGVGNTMTMTQGRTPRDRVTLKIDDENGIRPSVSLSVGFVANLTLSWVGSVGMNTSQTHAYSVSGTMAFVDATTGADLLTIALGNQTPAGLAIGGTMTQWARSGALFGSDNAGGGTVTYRATSALLAAGTAAGFDLTQYGILAGANDTSIGPDDAGFSLSFVNASGGNVPIDSVTRLPTAAWSAEGSYSGAARWGVPTPGAAMTLGAGTLLVLGRRRR